MWYSLLRLCSRKIVLAVTAVFALYFGYCALTDPNFQTGDRFAFDLSDAEQHLSSQETLQDLQLTAEQCEAAFPGLVDDVGAAVARGPFQLRKYSNDYYGDVQGRIKDGNLYLISVAPDGSKHMIEASGDKEHRTATLNSLYRAVITSPEPLPDTYFSLSVHDNPKKNSWVYSRPTSPDKQDNYWLMPPFALWAWNSPLIGTMETVLSRITAVEATFDSFADKIDRAVWRGTVHYNPIDNTRLRTNLLAFTQGKDWANVAQLSYPHTGNGLRMEDHCRYKYVIYTEGVTYSGRLPYHQACASVLITTPILHHTYSTHRLRPLFSSSLELNPANFSEVPPEIPTLAPNYSAPDASWPRSYSPEEADVIFVAPDWSDLEAVIQWLRDHEDAAAGIANRLRTHYAQGGYLSQAAEACYWRALIRGWASVAEVETGDAEGQWNPSEAVRFEEYIVRGDLDESSIGKGG